MSNSTKKSAIILLACVASLVVCAAWFFERKSAEQAAFEELVMQVAEDIEDCIKAKGGGQQARARCVVEEGMLLTEEFGAEKAAKLVVLAIK